MFLFQVRKIISQLILPIINYADIVYQNSSDTHLRPLNVVYNSLCRFVLRSPYRTHHCFMYESFNWLQPKSGWQFHWVQFIFQCLYFNCTSYLILFWCHAYLPIHSDICKKKSDAGHFNTKLHPTGIIFLSFLRSISSFHFFRTYLFSHLTTTCLCRVCTYNIV